MSMKLTYRMHINAGLGYSFSHIDFQQFKIFHNGPRNFPQEILIPSKVTDQRWIKNFDLSCSSMIFSELPIKRISFEKNIVEYNLFAIKLSSDKIKHLTINLLGLFRSRYAQPVRQLNLIYIRATARVICEETIFIVFSSILLLVCTDMVGCQPNEIVTLSIYFILSLIYTEATTRAIPQLLKKLNQFNFSRWRNQSPAINYSQLSFSHQITRLAQSPGKLPNVNKALVCKRHKLCECLFPMLIHFHPVRLGSACCVQSPCGTCTLSKIVKNGLTILQQPAINTQIKIFHFFEGTYNREQPLQKNFQVFSSFLHILYLQITCVTCISRVAKMSFQKLHSPLSPGKKNSILFFSDR